MNKLLSALVIATVFPVYAQAGADFIEGDKTFAGEAELGGTLTTGNSESSSIKGRLNMKHELGNWENTYLLEALYNENTDSSDGSKTENQSYQAGAQGNYRFDSRNYLFANANYYRDQSTGYDYTISSSAGYGYRAYESATAFMDLEIGPGYQYQQLTGEEALLQGIDSQDSAVAHGVMNFETKISDSSTFKQKFVADYGDKLLARSETSLSANVIGALAMKLSFVVRYDDKPLAGKKSTDTETNMTLLYAF
ncbi:MAG: DUF481 domain-containing protein [Shewanella sp.]|nr:DUF481 domain-containing protein [Shewanella sp.]MCF1432010.1 DUF481 domain-containing protein [Shewanella sp.]MCF1439704.1 DUF481 domain-containing protein [Shewanella sp.]MCF1459634.1 DUF481 domain-containing protein [Shewanella sp.]